jgi:hypothetical protein
MVKYVDPKLIKQELEKIRKSKHFGYQRVRIPPPLPRTSKYN